MSDSLSVFQLVDALSVSRTIINEQRRVVGEGGGGSRVWCRL